MLQVSHTVISCVHEKKSFFWSLCQKKYTKKDMGEKKLIPPCQYTKYAYEKRKKYQTQKMRTNKWHTIEKNKNEKNTIYL